MTENITNTQTPKNPLSQYYRQPKLYIKIPSAGRYYKDKVVIELNEDGEIPIYAMTAKDEIALKNPDGLFNGESLVAIINSCAPSVKFPKELVVNDIEAILTGVKLASYGETSDIEVKCPICEADNKFAMNLQLLLNTMTQLDPEYVANLDNNLTLYIRPYTYVEYVKVLRTAFEQSKINNVANNDQLSEEEKIKLFSQSFNKIALLNFELINDSIYKIVNDVSEEKLVVTDRKQIKEFITNCEKKHADEVMKVCDEINKQGLKKELDAKCQKCEHTWQVPLSFNPVTFFI